MCTYYICVGICVCYTYIYRGKKRNEKEKIEGGKRMIPLISISVRSSLKDSARGALLHETVYYIYVYHSMRWFLNPPLTHSFLLSSLNPYVYISILCSSHYTHTQTARFFLQEPFSPSLFFLPPQQFHPHCVHASPLVLLPSTSKQQ